MSNLPRPIPGILATSALILIIAILSAGCTGPASSPPGSPSNVSVPASGDNPSWKIFPLTDLKEKGNFSITSFSGKPVLVPILSEDCPTCIVLLNRQLAEIDRLPGVREGKITVVSLDLDPAGGPGYIVAHHDQYNFTGYSARSPEDLTLNLLHTFGPFAIDTSAAPVILVCPDGHDLLLPNGVKTAEVLGATLEEEC